MNWKPWKDFKNVKQATLPIEEPPCKHCRHWRPVAIFDEDGAVDRVRCCHAEDQFRDFSCYEKGRSSITA